MLRLQLPADRREPRRRGRPVTLPAFVAVALLAIGVVQTGGVAGLHASPREMVPCAPAPTTPTATLTATLTSAPTSPIPTAPPTSTPMSPESTAPAEPTSPGPTGCDPASDTTAPSEPPTPPSPTLPTETAQPDTSGASPTAVPTSPGATPSTPPAKLPFTFEYEAHPQGPTGRCSVTDRSTSPPSQITCTDVVGYRKRGRSVVLTGHALLNGEPTWYRIAVFDAAGTSHAADTFTIETDSGYSAGGPVIKGDLTVR
jgi:hypothetical protein